MPNANGLWTAQEVADHFAISLKKIQRWMKYGELTCNGDGLMTDADIDGCFKPVRVQYPISRYAKQLRLRMPLLIDSTDEIIDTGIAQWLGKPCIYFLLNEERHVLYVGQSVCLPSRIAQHYQDGKKFHSVSCLHVPKEQLDETELMFINKYEPPLNQLRGYKALWEEAI